jgi:oligopeptide transport system permease protein
MIRLIFRRLVGAVVVVFFVATLGFLALRLAPGTPYARERALAPEIERNIAARYRFDVPVWRQYLEYLGGLAQGDLGYSIARSQTVNEIVAENFPRSLQLGLLALAFAAGIGIPLGVAAARRHNRAADHAAMALALAGISVPAFVLGPILVLFFALRLAWLPPARWDSLAATILPAITLGTIFLGMIARLTRGGMLETLRQDYVRTARAKGVPESQVVWRHAFRLGILPVVTFLGPATAILVAGSFVVEKIFQIPGLGFYFIASVSDRDYPLLTGVMVFYCLLVVMLNLAADLAHLALDPRTREAV